MYILRASIVPRLIIRHPVLSTALHRSTDRTLDVPYYMVVTVSGPWAPVDERRIDGLVAMSLREELG